MVSSASYRLATSGLLVALLSIAHPAMAAPDLDCFQQIEHNRGGEVACTFPTRLTEAEKADLKRITREMLMDARCTVAIRVERRLIDEALAAADHVFAAPPQPVTCELETREKVVTITGSFAPRVEFAAGLAIDASPGLGQVEGVPAVLSWPVVQYVNRSKSIREGMLAVINAYRAHYARKGLASSR